MARAPLKIADVEIRAGERRSLRIPLTRRYTQAEVFLPTHVVHGREPGPRLFVCAAVHGDEINGVEIVHRLLRQRALRRLRGTLLAVPIVNIYGLVAQSRYLPDRRDLNRAFPGSASGSLTARLANLFMTEIVQDSTHGIDLHTGSMHRSNLPQVRACLDQEETARLAKAFGTPVILNSTLRDGSLRSAVNEKGIPMLVYEAGEALRFDELGIRAGLRGILSVMRGIGMLPASSKVKPGPEPFVARSSAWVRAPQSGILRTEARLGQRVDAGQRLGTIGTPLDDEETEVLARERGIVIGRTELPLVNEGDALFHVASFKRPRNVAQQIEAYHEELSPEDEGIG
jgi:predicted deacylase